MRPHEVISLSPPQHAVNHGEAMLGGDGVPYAVDVGASELDDATALHTHEMVVCFTLERSPVMSAAERVQRDQEAKPQFAAVK